MAIVEVKVPQLSESVAEATMLQWKKKVGESVTADEILIDIETDKVVLEVPAPASGVLCEILVANGGTVAAEQLIARIDTDGKVGASAPAAASAAVAASAPAAPADTYVTPLVRRLAAENGVDLATLTGTGVGGRIRKQDVLAAVEAARTPAATAAPGVAQPIPVAASTASGAASAPASPATTSAVRGTTEPLSRLRSIIAQRMVESLQTSAQLTTVVEVDLTRVAQLRDRAKAEFEAREGTKLTFLPFFALATVEALKAFPQLNASLDLAAGTVTYHEAEHLGIAVDSAKGLLVPVVRDAGGLNLAGLAKAIADVAARTRSNKLSPDELSGGTFTITNTGSRGALFDTPIINQPQVGILGTGSVVKRPVVVSDPTGDVIAIRQMVYLALTYDHRLVDGADAARFLTTVKARLVDGAFESDLGLV